MRRICVEIDGRFYKSCNQAGKIIGCADDTIKRRCLSDKFPNYKIVPYRPPKEKKCPKCGIIKPLDEFHKDSKSKDGHVTECKECIKTRGKQYRQNNQGKITKRKKEYRRKNREKLKQQQKEYRQNNKEKVTKSRKKYCKKNPAKVAKQNKEHQKRKYKNDPAFKLNKNMSRAIRRSLRGEKNGAPWKTLVPYTFDELKKHLISTIPEGYTWNDYLEGRLHLDHIIPLSLWNITSAKSKGFQGAWALENLRLIPAEENLKKSNILFY